jgi:Animal haem peroxidase
MSEPGVPPFRPTLAERLLAAWASRIDRTIGWSRLPRYTGAAALAGLRITLRKTNLAGTEHLPSTGGPGASAQPVLTARTADGTWNDLQVPTMGAANTRFGRNVSLEHVYPEPDDRLLTPSPRRVSRELLTRRELIPAKSLNLHAAAWIQFMVHDWLSHGKNEKENPWLVDLDPDDDWPERPMRILRTRRDPTRPPDAHGAPPTFANIATHWWDASQLYGSDQATQDTLRTGEGGRLRIGTDGLLPLDPDLGVAATGVNGNWWIGLDLMHTLFSLEHNAIAGALRAEYPTWSDQELFDRARLITAALTAKIHTVEWTPAILAHPTLQLSMRANWWGLEGQRLHEAAGRLSPSEWVSGIPGSETAHFGVPFSITEEFVSVYRMHPLLRDEYPFRSVADGRELEVRELDEVTFKGARPVLERVGMGNALYSFGVLNPGAVTLHNYPKAMQRFEEPDFNGLNDLAAVDILRSRERGVPRYNEFRRLLHRPALTSFEQLSDNPDWNEEIRSVYDGDLERVDLQVGLYAETPPAGFGFSDTAFRIFILMASRRLNSDRFFTTDWTPEVYTPLGMRWIEDNGFVTVLLRHFPELRPALRAGRNPFAPWDAA